MIDGRLVLLSPTGLHQYFAVQVVNALSVNCPDGYLPVPDLSLRGDLFNERRPDVVVLDDRYLERSPAPVDRVILNVEIVSPSSKETDSTTKKKIYAAAGVASYWVIDPAPRAGVMLTEFRLNRHGIYEVVGVTDEVFTTQVPFPVTVDLPAFTKRRDKYKN